MKDPTLANYPKSLRKNKTDTLELVTPLKFMGYHNRTQRWFKEFEKRLQHIKNNVGEWVDQNIEEIYQRIKSNPKRSLKEMLRCQDVALLEFFIEKEILGVKK